MAAGIGSFEMLGFSELLLNGASIAKGPAGSRLDCVEKSTEDGSFMTSWSCDNNSIKTSEANLEQKMLARNKINPNVLILQILMQNVDILGKS